MAPNYEKSKIYKIVCNTSGLVYYGATTTNNLAIRLATHKNNYRNERTQLTSYNLLKPIFENNNYKIILVEKFKCEDKAELEQYLQNFIENNKSLNRSYATN